MLFISSEKNCSTHKFSNLPTAMWPQPPRRVLGVGGGWKAVFPCTQLGECRGRTNFTGGQNYDISRPNWPVQRGEANFLKPQLGK